MLRWMSEVTKLDRIRNERIRGTTKVGEISTKVQESRLKWYQPFHRDSCDILTKNNILLVPNLYNNYSGLVKLRYFVKVVASYALAKKRH